MVIMHVCVNVHKHSHVQDYVQHLGGLPFLVGYEILNKTC